MDEKNGKSLQERVTQLEVVVAELQSKLEQNENAFEQNEQKKTHIPLDAPVKRQQADVQNPVKKSATKPPESKESFELPENMRSIEYWFNKIGIGLVLLGVAFLFKYSIDQGWLTPTVRVAFGLILGTGLIVAGNYIFTKRRNFGQVLLGGGIATFYITGFAAFQLFALISSPLAFGFMICVTLLAFFLSLKLDGAVLAIIGAIGGLGTPFLLYTGAGDMTGLISYTCLILAGICAIYFYCGWRSLLWISVIGGWTVFIIALNRGLPADPQEAIGDRWVLQSGIVFGWLAFWALPLLRELAWIKNPERWARLSANYDEKFITKSFRDILDKHVHLLSIFIPLIALAISIFVWSLTYETWGWITLGGVVVYGLAAWRLSLKSDTKDLAYTHFLAAVILQTIALFMLLEGNSLLFALAVEATALHLIARQLSGRAIVKFAHYLFIFLGLWLLLRLFSDQTQGTAILNIQALTDLWVIVAASVISLLLSSYKQRNVYLLFVHIAILGWFLRELSSLPSGQGYVTIAWGVYAVTLLVISLRLNLEQLRNLATGTLLLVVGKLFLVDLTELETIWRVLLFIGFGAIFLILSYYSRTLWKSDDKI
ncbi:MAG: DUF2339 domain-containing protein [Balneolales bacterium]|nr:DUF2339 domain-containing protein [Balneolales bacterium]